MVSEYKCTGLRSRNHQNALRRLLSPLRNPTWMLSSCRASGILLSPGRLMGGCLKAAVASTRWSEKGEFHGVAAPMPQVLVVSYDRAGSGHFSPIGAYHAASDSVLVLDVARFKYPPHWIKLPRLVKAMYPIDNATGNSRGYIVLGRQRPGSLPPEAGPKLLALASIPTSATMALTTAFQNEIQRQSAEVELSLRQPTLSQETYLEELFRCFLRAVAKLDSPIMRGVFFAVAEQRRLVDTINAYWTPQGDSEDDDKASIVATLLHAFGDESSHPPVAGRLPPMFGPSRD
ncbi:hypothetical protein FOZ62_025866, partial [Perkinsus olseni]